LDRVIDTEMIKDVTIKNFSSFHDNEFSHMIDKESDPISSRNPFFLRGEEWKSKRAEITPALSANRVNISRFTYYFIYIDFTIFYS
jgi:hypothetical protein